MPRPTQLGRHLEVFVVRLAEGAVPVALIELTSLAQ